ncbi:hypothetical protein ACFLVY_00025 [Chloroflexota bacterium]
MHRQFRSLLDNAEGISEFIIALNLDIRRFSEFSKRVESPEVALFIKKVYAKIIDNYFDYASFFKPTGDGLLITIPYDEQNLVEISQTTFNSCFKVIEDFASLCVDEAMINFEVPQSIGIGLSRGTACRLVSGDVTLDYSGAVLNLASRLMDFARPSGIVFDAKFGIELLSPEHIELFNKDAIYIKGIAESQPIDIFYTKGLTNISPLSKEPIVKVSWETVTDIKTLRQIKERGRQHWYSLPTKPINVKDIEVKVTHGGIVRGKKTTEFSRIHHIRGFKYVLEAGKPNILVPFGSIAKILEKAGVRSNWEVAIEIMYRDK